MDKYSNDEICEKIWKIEKQNLLLDYKINDVYIWRLIRLSVYNMICNEFKIFEKNKKYQVKKYNIIKNKLNLLKNSIQNDAMKGNYEKDILVFNHNRKVCIDGRYLDPSTDYFIKYLEELGEDYEIIDAPHNDKHYISKSEHVKYGEGLYNIDIFVEYYLKKNFSRYRKEILKAIEYFENIIDNEFNIKLDISSLVFKSFYSFKSKFKFYDRLIKKRNPKEIYLVVGYCNQPIIAAAKNNKVKVIEFQHGVIDKYHLGYSFPNDKNVPYFPDEIFLYGEYWYDSCYMPINKDNIKVIGNPYMEERIKAYKNLDKIDNKIIFLSQWTIGNRLSKLACEFAINNPEYEVIYKLHPEEYDNWKEKYKFLKDNMHLSNLKIIDNNEKNLYELLASSKYQVGVYSTAIYEGIMLNCKTILVNLPGISYMEYLIKNDICKVVNTHMKLGYIINNPINIEENINKSYFFETLNLQNNMNR